MTEFRKIKDMNKKSNTKPKTEKQLEASRKSGIKVMLTKNPMKNPKSIEKMRKKLIGKKRPDLTLRNLKDNPAKKNPPFKGKKQSEEAKLRHSLKMTGRPGNEKSKVHMIRMVLLNNPMKNKTTADKQHLNDKRNIGLKEKTFEMALKEFNSGKSINLISKEMKISRWTLYRAFRRRGFKYDIKGRLRMYAQNNLNIQKGWFKKPKTEVQNEKNNTNTIPFSSTTDNN